VPDDEPADRAGQQGPHLQAAVAVEEVGEPAAHRPLRRLGCYAGRFHGTWVMTGSRPATSPLDLGPGRDPVVVVLAHIAAVIAAIRARGVPVVDPLPERRVRRVVAVAE